MSDELLNGRELQEGWRQVKLGDISDITKLAGYEYTKHVKYIRDGEIIALRAVNIGDCDLILDNVQRISKAVSDALPRSKLHKGELLLSYVGTVGSVAVVPEDNKFHLAPNVAKITVTKKGICDAEFLMYYLLSGRGKSEIAAYTSKTSQPVISMSKIRLIKMILPTLPEQRAIAHALRTAQAAREARRREVALERECKAALMQRLFTRGTRGEPTKTAEIGEVPVSWDVVELGNVVTEKIKDGVHQTPRYVQDGVPFITAKDIVDNQIVFGKCSFISNAEHELLSSKVRPEQGDILLTKVGSVGNVALVRDDTRFSIFVQVALIKPDRGKVYPDFLFNVLQSEALQQEIDQKSSQSTMKFIGTQKIAVVRMPRPSLDEQRAIVAILRTCDDKIAALEREVAAHDELFKALLEELMTRKLGVTELIDSL
jgi:type I restriction enzyme, S subunit